MNAMTITRIRLLNVIIMVLIMHLMPNNVFSQYSSHNMGNPTYQKGRFSDNNRQRHSAMMENRLPASWDAFDFYKPTAVTGDVEMAWVNTYASGLANGAARAYAVAVDNSGNVYVAGGSGGLIRLLHGYSFAGESALIIKYSAAGARQWVVEYDGGGNRSAEIISIAVDNSGNVYVGGFSGVLSHCDEGRSSCGYESKTMLTAKYNAAGVEQWVVEYYGLGDGSAEAKAIAVDVSGNIFVIGESSGLNEKADYVTIKYSSDGVEEWVMRYDGPSSQWDFVRAIALDDLGNVYVTGGSEGDYATIKYNADGVEQWVARYNGRGGPGAGGDEASSIALDELGNVYVTGSSYNSTTGMTMPRSSIVPMASSSGWQDILLADLGMVLIVQKRLILMTQEMFM